jgi:hypothetical protein
MQTNQPLRIAPSVTFLRWGARLLSSLILLFWGWFLLAHLFGEAGQSSRPLTTPDYVGLTALLVSLVGLAVAWKDELVGGALTLAAVGIGAFINWRVLAFPATLIPVAAVGFLACWWMSRGPCREPPAVLHS